ncbi:hypothetical protein RND71_010999 [Anisodus tanguticus]|uniref:Uncharacterized protein n=1 Tax=Anisodus tanguticus TaxID=243964 RepID=A0AAE1SKU0_9SOLA|nr:hypothetical protein RND71_010999 [Anisodus tanguticus]
MAVVPGLKSGVASTKRQRVVALALPNFQLQGTISHSLANLSFLRELNLGNYFFHGDIPYGLGNLRRLQVINFRNNKLQGSIPTSLFQHERIRVISLAFNKLNSEMWKGPWNVPELRVLDLSNNNLGLFHQNYWGFNISSLEYIAFTANNLTGRIPATTGRNLPNLIAFYLGLNQLEEEFAKYITNASRLYGLVLARNFFTGIIPANLGDS